jgi:hypothetical protein
MTNVVWRSEKKTRCFRTGTRGAARRRMRAERLHAAKALQGRVAVCRSASQLFFLREGSFRREGVSTRAPRDPRDAGATPESERWNLFRLFPPFPHNSAFGGSFFILMKNEVEWPRQNAESAKNRTFTRISRIDADWGRGGQGTGRQDARPYQGDFAKRSHLRLFVNACTMVR